MGEKIFFVSKNPQLRRDADGALAHGTYGLEVIEDPEQAIDRVFAERPALLVQDVDLPGRNGQSLLEAAKFLNPAMPVVCLVDKANMDWVYRARGMTGVTFMPAPPDWNHIRETAALFSGAALDVVAA